jgi:hypothetical protein
MDKRPALCIVAALASTSLSTPVSAHHSYRLAGFDPCESTSIEGVIQRVTWKDPHVFLTVSTGDKTVYQVEWFGLAKMSVEGIQLENLRVGDRIVVTGSKHPSSDFNLVSLLTEVRIPESELDWSRPFPADGDPQLPCAVPQQGNVQTRAAAPRASAPVTGTAPVTVTGAVSPPGGLRHFPMAIDLEASPENSANVALGDLDGDRDLDLVLAKGRHTPLLDRILLNDGRGKFESRELGPIADRTYSAVLSDVDVDGDLDVLVSNDRPDRKMVYLNDGMAHFRDSGTWGAPEWSTRNAAVADLNADGAPDVIAANRPGPSYVCLNDGRGAFLTPCSAIPIAAATSVVAADFNNDEFIDLAVPHRDGGQSLVFVNDGHANFSKTVPFGPPSAAARVAASADLDGDGWQDLVVGDERAASMVVYLNDTKGGFIAGFEVTDRSRVPYAAETGDLNRDGRTDIVMGYIGAPSAVFFNDGSARQFTEVRFGDGLGDAYGFALGDVNEDGYPDIALARSGATNVIYVNEK